MKEYIIKLIKADLSNAKDNLYRAEHAFRGHDLSEHYGHSADTKDEIIEGYRKWANQAQQALDEALKG